MCKKLRFCARKIDPCLKNMVNYLRKIGLNPILCCCGHERYDPTIIMKNRDDTVYELFSNKKLKNYNPKLDKRHNIYYEIDAEKFYFIPEVISG